MSGKDNEKEDAKLDDELSEDTSEDTLAETVVMSDDDGDASVGDSTVEMDIERLVAKLEASDSDDVHRRAEMRHKLEELRELREQELDSTFNISLDDED
jgi:hypothetical protein